MEMRPCQSRAVVTATEQQQQHRSGSGAWAAIPGPGLAGDRGSFERKAAEGCTCQSCSSSGFALACTQE